MEVMDAILTRRSIRQYTGKLASEGEIRQILRAGSHAPSAHNRQPWQFIVLQKQEILQQIAKMHPYAKMMPDAGTCIIVCGDTERQAEIGFLAEDCSAAIENMLLAAWGIGLGSVWCGLYPIPGLTDAIRAIISLPAAIVPIGMIAVGHGAEERSVGDRYDETKVHWDKW